jgi:hypothetical protein
VQKCAKSVLMQQPQTKSNLNLEDKWYVPCEKLQNRKKIVSARGSNGIEEPQAWFIRGVVLVGLVLVKQGEVGFAFVQNFHKNSKTKFQERLFSLTCPIYLSKQVTFR